MRTKKTEPSREPFGGHTAPSADHGTAFLNCSLCLAEKPKGVSPKDWARQQGAFTRWGFQLWCVRHEVNIIHIDFEGIRHPADDTREAVRP